MRSLTSIFITQLLVITQRKKKLADPAVFDKRVQDLLARGEEPYLLDYKKFTVDVEKSSLNGMDYYILRSRKKHNANKMMYFHGGGFISQPIEQHWKLLNKIVEDTGTETWVPVYPKIPFHDATYAYPLLIALYKVLAESTGDGRIAFMGDSAGGGIVLGMAEQIKALAIKQPSELIMISPFLDAAMTSPETKEIEPKDAMLGIYGTQRCGELWAGDIDLKDPLISPLYGDITGLGNMTIFTGTYDLINPDTHRLLEKSKELQIPIDFNEIEGMQHVYPLLPIPEAKKAIQKMETILTRG